jgi:hypothetical protein
MRPRLALIATRRNLGYATPAVQSLRRDCINLNMSSSFPQFSSVLPNEPGVIAGSGGTP